MCVLLSQKRQSLCQTLLKGNFLNKVILNLKVLLFVTTTFIIILLQIELLYFLNLITHPTGVLVYQNLNHQHTE